MGLAGVGDILVAIAAILFSMSGFAYLFGDSRLAKRMVVSAVILAVSAPLFEASLVHLAETAGRYADVLLITFAASVVVLVLSKVGRRTDTRGGAKPTSRKKRLDD